MERKIIQYKSKQLQHDSDKQVVALLETTDPELVGEMLKKKRWQHEKKDPARNSLSLGNDVHNYWESLNHLPKKGVKSIVNDKIIARDKDGCGHIL